MSLQNARRCYVSLYYEKRVMDSLLANLLAGPPYKALQLMT